MYLRWITNPNTQNEYEERMTNLINEEADLKMKAAKLRRLVMNLAKNTEQNH